MEVRKISLDYQYKEDELALTIGFFDGIHMGHKELIDKVLSSGYTPSVLTFSLDMKNKVRSHAIPLLLDEKEKERKMESLGIEKYFLLEFDEEVMNASIDEFLSFIRGLNPKLIVIGEDFTFGKQGKGKSYDFLSLAEEGIHVDIVPLLKSNDQKISSSSIRSYIEEGKIEDANQLLGYEFMMKGTVIHGLKNGRKIGFPTANMKKQEGIILPKSGVYRTRTKVNDKIYSSMTNIGNHPTIDTLEEDIIETHLIDFHEDLYGKDIEVHFLQYLRDQRKFDSLEELEKQLSIDVEKCK